MVPELAAHIHFLVAEVFKLFICLKLLYNIIMTKFLYKLASYNKNIK